MTHFFRTLLKFALSFDNEYCLTAELFLKDQPTQGVGEIRVSVFGETPDEAIQNTRDMFPLFELKNIYIKEMY